MNLRNVEIRIRKRYLFIFRISLFQLLIFNLQAFCTFFYLPQVYLSETWVRRSIPWAPETKFGPL